MSPHTTLAPSPLRHHGFMRHAEPAKHDAPFRHEALLYAGEQGFLEGVLPFLHEAIAADAPALVAVSARRIASLSDALGAERAARVQFADMTALGRNPGRIIPAWHDFAAAHADAERLYGVGEPIWAGRSDDELVECHRHEALLNLAFAGLRGFRLLCPYDTEGLAPAVVAEACRTHPCLIGTDGSRESPAYSGLSAIAAPFDAPLAAPPASAEEVAFDGGTVGAVRVFVTCEAVAAGVGPARREDLVLAVDELATNSVRHGGGHGSVRLWSEDDALVCEVHDAGRIADPLAGRARPTSADAPGGYGLWLVHQLCDLVEVRTRPDGTTVRVRVARATAPA